MSNRISGICLFAVAVVVLSLASPQGVLAVGSTQKGTQISVNGTLHFVYGTESCAGQPNCTSGLTIIPYLAVGNGQNYILIGGKADIWPDGQRMLVTGWLTTPSGSAPSLLFAADMIVTSIYAHCHMHSSG